MSFPAEASAFASITQVAPKANVDESLQSAKGNTGVGVTVVIRPPQYYLVDLTNKFIGHNRCPPFGEGLDLTTDVMLRCFAAVRWHLDD